MKNLFLNLIIIFIILLYSLSKISFAKNKNLVKNLFELKKKGWIVIKEHEVIEIRPGIKPYQNLKRVVQVINYKLKKGNEVLFCKVEYDSQLDKITDECD